MVLSDLNADSDNKLLIVDHGNGTTLVKLKVKWCCFPDVIHINIKIYV